MRVDVRIDHSRARNYHAYLNGERVKYAVAADEEEGWVDHVVVIDNKVIWKEGSHHYATARVHGKVELVPTDYRELKLDKP